MKDDRRLTVDISIILVVSTFLMILITPLTMITTQALMGRHELLWVPVAILVIVLLVFSTYLFARIRVKYLLMGIFSSIYAALLLFTNVTLVPTMMRQAENYEPISSVPAPGGFEPSVSDVSFVENLFWIAFAVFVAISIASFASFISHRIKERREHTFKIVRS